MKKTLSVILAIVMMLSCVAAGFGVFAADKCAYCDDCTGEADCTCCIHCPNLDKGRIQSCVKTDENGEYVYCCADCSGLWPFDCGKTCGCETCNGQSVDVDDGTGDPVLTPEQQEGVITGFQKIIKQIAAVFDRIFNAIFEFLRISDSGWQE